jgi:hypothetical protein
MTIRDKIANLTNPNKMTTMRKPHSLMPSSLAARCLAILDIEVMDGPAF